MSVNFPFGVVDAPTLTATGAQAVTIENQNTILKTPTITGGITFNLTISSELKSGAVIWVVVKTTGTETVTYGTGFFDGQTGITGVAGKTFSQLFIYDGTDFKAASAKIQLD